MSLQGWEGEGMGLSGLPATLGHVGVGLSQDLMVLTLQLCPSSLKLISSLGPPYLNNWI